MVGYNVTQILAGVRSHLSDASNDLQGVDDDGTEPRRSLLRAADLAIDAAICAVIRLTDEPEFHE